MITDTEDVATTMEQIFSVVVKEKIGPDGFSEADPSADWLGLDARDCKNQVERCRAWIRTQDRTKTIRPGVSSAGYMHTVERYFNHPILRGAFLTAAYLEGVAIKRRRTDANFNFRINRHRNVL